jgi:hypothetical protein
VTSYSGFLDLPAFEGTRLEIVEQTIEWVHLSVARALPSEEWIRARFLRRTIGEIITDGFTLAYMPCLERTLVTMAMLGRHGIECNLLLEEFPGCVWHFAIEVEREDGSWVFADYQNRESRLIDGRYRYALVPESIPRFMRIRGPKFSPDIWNARPPLRMLASMGVSLSMRYDRFCQLRDSYQAQVLAGEYSLGDRLVRDPADSMWAELWANYPILEARQSDGRYADFPDVRLYLEHI